MLEQADYIGDILLLRRIFSRSTLLRHGFAAILCPKAKVLQAVPTELGSPDCVHEMVLAECSMLGEYFT